MEGACERETGLKVRAQVDVYPQKSFDRLANSLRGARARDKEIYRRVERQRGREGDKAEIRAWSARALANLQNRGAGAERVGGVSGVHSGKVRAAVQVDRQIDV